MKTPVLLFCIIFLISCSSIPFFEIDQRHYATGFQECHDPKLKKCFHVSIAKNGCPEDCHFDPEVFTIKTGTIVEWGNHDDDAHKIYEDNSRFGSSELAPAEEKLGEWTNYDESHFSYTFDEPGTYSYRSLNNNLFVGKITVIE